MPCTLLSLPTSLVEFTLGFLATAEDLASARAVPHPAFCRLPRVEAPASGTRSGSGTRPNDRPARRGHGDMERRHAQRAMRRHRYRKRRHQTCADCETARAHGEVPARAGGRWRIGAVPTALAARYGHTPGDSLPKLSRCTHTVRALASGLLCGRRLQPYQIATPCSYHRMRPLRLCSALGGATMAVPRQLV